MLIVAYVKEAIRRVRRLLFRLLKSHSIRARQYSSVVKDRGDPIRLNFGCGDVHLEKYVNIDIVPSPATDLVMDMNDLNAIPSNSVDEFRMDAAFEHIYRFQQEALLEEIHRVLKPGGKLAINWLPDFDVIAGAYLAKAEGVRGDVFDLYNVYRYTHGDPDPSNAPFQIHKDIFTKASLRKMLEKRGFEVKSLKNEAYRGEKLALNINLIAAKR